MLFRRKKVESNPNQNHYYETDLWSREGEKYAHLVPKNTIVYGELIGWVGENSPIQGNYTYNVPNGDCHLYVYRVAVVTADGGLYDLPWEGVKQFCAERGLNCVVELWSGRHANFVPEEWIDFRFADLKWEEGVHPIPLSDKKTVDEGVVVRWDGLVPTVLKAKSPIFLGHESKMLDQEIVDIESDV